MSRNRHRDSNSLKMLPVFKAMVVCVIIGGLAFVYLSQKTRLMRLGDDIKKLEDRIDVVRRQNENLTATIHLLKGPKKIANRTRLLQQGLVPPGEHQFIRVQFRKDAGRYAEITRGGGR